ncbi:unnamed protein product, partial [Coregonus sp. 'balchen']
MDEMFRVPGPGWGRDLYRWDGQTQCELCSPHHSLSAKPISLVERCWCRSTLNTVPQRSIRELKFLHTPNCPFQVIAKLKNNREVCINPETKWLQTSPEDVLSKGDLVPGQLSPSSSSSTTQICNSTYCIYTSLLWNALEHSGML